MVNIGDEYHQTPLLLKSLDHSHLREPENPLSIRLQEALGMDKVRMNSRSDLRRSDHS